MAKKQGVDRIWEAIEDIRLCMLTSQDGGSCARGADGGQGGARRALHLVSDRPPRPQGRGDRPNPQASRGLRRHAEQYLGVDLAAGRRSAATGTRPMGAVDDGEPAWFPGGPDDPNLGLLRLDAGRRRRSGTPPRARSSMRSKRRARRSRAHAQPRRQREGGDVAARFRRRGAARRPAAACRAIAERPRPRGPSRPAFRARRRSPRRRRRREVTRIAESERAASGSSRPSACGPIRITKS